VERTGKLWNEHQIILSYPRPSSDDSCGKRDRYDLGIMNVEAVQRKMLRGGAL
jgi:hypothetical protein